MTTSINTGPPPSVLKAFNLSDSPTPLSGGQGRSFLVSSTVLKPVSDISDAEAEWSSQIMATLACSTSPQFQVPGPILASSSMYVYEGWTASKFCPGDYNINGKFMDLISASRGFHEALKPFPEPEFLAENTHPWALADRVAWGEASAEVVPSLSPTYSELLKLRQNVSPSERQLVHADLSGNVLFFEDNPPVIIDFSPFWRPVEYAEAIAVMDGIMWFGVEKRVVDMVGTGEKWYQMLVRALTFRVVARSELEARGMFSKILKKELDMLHGAMELVKDKIRGCS